MLTLKDQVENELGYYIGNCIFLSAYQAGKRKLKHILLREGDANAERRKDYYLVLLIAEAVKSGIAAEILKNRHKEKAPCPPADAPITKKINISVPQCSEFSKEVAFRV